MTVVRVLLVDDDPFSLKLLEKMLQHCKYDVTATSTPATAMQLLKDESQRSYDLLLGDARMMQTDGWELFDVANGEMDLPVVLISATADKETITNAVLRGAKDFLTKPIRLEQIKTLWLHVERKKAFEFVERSPRNDDGEDGIEGEHDNVDQGNCVMASSESMNTSEDEHSDEQMETDNGDSNEDWSNRRKKRVVWTKELHAKFLEAMNMINPQMLSKKSLTDTSSGAVPRLILKAMNVPELTLQNVSSHLQKFRLHMKREQDSRIATTVSMPNQYHRDGRTEFTFPPGSMVNQAPQPSTTGPPLSTSIDHLLIKNRGERGLTGFRGHNYFRTMGSVPIFQRQSGLPERVLGSSSTPLYSVPTGYQHQFSGWNSSSYMQSRRWNDSYRAPHFDARVDHLRNTILPQGNALGRESTDSLATMGNFSSALMRDTTLPFQANTSELGTAAEALQRGPVIGGNLPIPSFTEGSFEQMSYQSNHGGQDTMSPLLAGTSRGTW